MLVGDLEGDLGGRPLADEPGERDGMLVAVEVADEDVAGGVDRGEVVELGRREPRLGAVEARATRALAETVEHRGDGLDVPVWQRANDQPSPAPELQVARLHHGHAPSEATTRRRAAHTETYGSVAARKRPPKTTPRPENPPSA